jgi:hypothetical protein
MGTWSLNNGTTACVTIGTASPTSVSCASSTAITLVFPAVVGSTGSGLCPNCTVGDLVTVTITN